MTGSNRKQPLTITACGACGNSEPRDLLIVAERGGLHRMRYACRPSVSAACLALVSPGGHAADAIALLIEPTPEELAGLRAAFAPRVQP
jgi:hypothetical protein